MHAIILPANSKIAYELTYSIAAFDLIPTDPLTDAIDEALGDLDRTANHTIHCSEMAQEIEYGTANPIINLILAIVVIIVICIILGISTLALYLPQSYVKIRKKAESTKKGIIWNAYIRFFIEEYIAISIAGLLKVYSLDFNNWYETVSSIFAIILLILAIIAPIVVWKVLYKKHEEGKVWDEEFTEKYGAMHEGVQQKEKGALLFHVVFMIRRFTLACAIVMTTNKTYF